MSQGMMRLRLSSFSGRRRPRCSGKASLRRMRQNAWACRRVPFGRDSGRKGSHALKAWMGLSGIWPSQCLEGVRAPLRLRNIPQALRDGPRVRPGKTSAKRAKMGRNRQEMGRQTQILQIYYKFVWIFLQGSFIINSGIKGSIEGWPLFPPIKE